MKNNENFNEDKFAVRYKNIFYIIGGFALMILGYILMTGGGTKDPNVFNEKEMFSFTRIVLAPILILLGFAAEIVAIMYKSKK